MKRIYRFKKFSATVQNLKLAVSVVYAALGAICLIRCISLMMQADAHVAQIAACAVALFVFAVFAAALLMSRRVAYFMDRYAPRKTDVQTVTIQRVDVRRDWTGLRHHVVQFQLREEDADRLVQGELIGLRRNQAPRPGDIMHILVKTIWLDRSHFTERLEWAAKGRSFES